MPPVDFVEVLMCGGGGGGGDCRVACETTAPMPTEAKPPEEEPDFPAESFRVRIGDEIDWTDLNPVYDRDDSTKGDTNPKSHHSNPKPRSNSQRLSGNLNPKTPIIGFPTKIHHSGYLGRSSRRPNRGRTLPKIGRAKASVVEPASPKVSCIGKVLSQRERDRCRRARREAEPKREREEVRGGGRWSVLAVVFKCFGVGKLRAAAAECVGDSPAQPCASVEGKAELSGGPPRLGGMKPFASGRRPASWGGGHVA